jgi:UDPglucose--hexose-1-phosphate uridylyltransferase
MHEIRQDLTTGQWVIYATERRDRPVDVHRNRAERTSLPSKDAHCPFCQADEAAVPEIVMEWPDSDPNCWQTQVVRNKYPVLVPETDVSGHRQGVYETMTAYGLNEIIVESPMHNADIPTMSPREVQVIIETYHRRYVDIYETDENIRCIIIFRNRGERAGTSLLHPHSQLVATAFVPVCISVQEQKAREHFEDHKSCLFCDIVKAELESGVRVVFENEYFVTFVPHAAAVPFQVWIVPKSHQPDFGITSEQDRAALADSLRDILQRLEDRVQSPHYNCIIRSFSRQVRPSRHLHWHVEIRPRLVTAAGFEIGSGVRINHSIPEEDAAILKGA